MKYFLLFLTLSLSILTFGQNKHLTLGIKNYGICFGNSKNNNGLRFNLKDKNVDTINGFDLTFISSARMTNGFNFGLISKDKPHENGIFINLISGSSIFANGIEIGGLAYSSRRCNGIGIGGLFFETSKCNGIGIGGLIMIGDTLNGLFFSAYKLGTGNNREGDTMGCINGIAFAPALLFSNKLNGLSLSFLRNDLDTLNGVAIAVFSNHAKVLHGFQFGLWNVAENNKIFKAMPILNFHLRRRKPSS